MRQKPVGRPSSSEQIIRDIKRKTRKQYSAEEKIRIVLDGLRGEDSIAELCRREGIAQSLYYKWSKDFMEAGNFVAKIPYTFALQSVVQCFKVSPMFVRHELMIALPEFKQLYESKHKMRQAHLLYSDHLFPIEGTAGPILLVVDAQHHRPSNEIPNQIIERVHRIDGDLVRIRHGSPDV